MKHEWIAALLHVLVVVFVYVVFGRYPYDTAPIPYFNILAFMIGAAYGVGGVVKLRTYLQTNRQAEFNMAALLVVAGFLIFMAAGNNVN